MVVMVGIDVHKDTHCAVAVDEVGRQSIAITQTRLDGLGRAYYERRRAHGDTSMEALRALKRRLASSSRPC